MSLKATIVPDMKYKRAGQGQQLRNLLKYLQFRDGSVRRDAYLRGEGYGGSEVSDSIKPDGRVTKWVDRGMGEGYSQISNKAQEWKGRSVLARTWVLSPDPDLMKHIPKSQRLDVMRRITEHTIETWYSDNGWGQPEYSYVIHDRLTNADQKQQFHSHIITPGTIPLDDVGALGRVDHLIKKPHIRDLHRTSAEILELEMDRVLGRERTMAILNEREEQLLAQRYPGRNTKHSLTKARQLYDIAKLLQGETIRKKAEKDRQKHERTARMRQQDLRMYARYIRDDHRQRREEGYTEGCLAREAAFEAELEEIRHEDEARLNRIRRKRQPDKPADIELGRALVFVQNKDASFGEDDSSTSRSGAPDIEL